MKTNDNFTIVVPTRNNEKIANDFLRNCTEIVDLDVILIDDCSDYNIDYFNNQRITVCKNKKKQSLTESWNQGVEMSKTENVIICSHKSRPKKQNFIKLETLLNEGYGLVALGGFHFFGFNKFLLSKIGMFDEGFKTGWWEDNDVLNKLCVNDIAYYLSEEVEDLKGESGWEGLYIQNKTYYFQKWDEHGDTIIQKKPDYPNKRKISISENILNYKKNIDSYHGIYSYKKYNNSKVLF
jgi:hypothetical protein